MQVSTIQQLKSAVLAHVPAAWVRDNFGKLTLKSTWEAAYENLAETIAAKADLAVEAAKEVATDVAESAVLLAEHAAIAVQDAIAETVTYDNITNLAFTATATVRSVAADALIAALKVAIVCYLFILEMLEEGKVERLQAEIAALSLPAVKSASDDGDLDIVDLGASADYLATLSAADLRVLCQRRGIQARRMTKPAMVAALV